MDDAVPWSPGLWPRYRLGTMPPIVRTPDGNIDLKDVPLFSRVALATRQFGAGTSEILFGRNTIGIMTGAASSVLGGEATLQLADPADYQTSPSMLTGHARAEVSGSTARVLATGNSAKVFGSATANTPFTARVEAAGDYSFAGGVARTLGADNDATVEATGAAAFAWGLAQPYVGYGSPSRIRATNTASMAFGSCLFAGDIEASGQGGLARGEVYGLSGRPGSIMASGRGSTAQGQAVGGSILASGAGTLASGYTRQNDAGVGATIQATLIGAHALGIANSNDFPATVEATGRASFAFGYAATVAGDNGPAVVRSSADGSFAFGLASYGNSLIESNMEGSFAGGVAVGYDTGSATVLASQPGAMAMGLAAGTGGSFGYLAATENGAMAFGKAIGGYIHAASEGSRAFGVTVDGNDIIASSFGAQAAGSARVTSDILASGEGAFAHGLADGADIVASAANSVQFGPGTNAVANSLKMGASGAGPWLMGDGLPASPVNGQLWIVAGDVFIRTGGVTQNISTLT